MVKLECEHEWRYTVPYRPNDSDGIVHVQVEAYCLNCGEERSSDYSWDIDEYHRVDKEGEYEKYQCDQCGAEMEDEGDFIELLDAAGYCDDTHICSQECINLWLNTYEEE